MINIYNLYGEFINTFDISDCKSWFILEILLLTYLVIFSLDKGKSIPDNAFANVAAEIEEANAILPPFYLEVLKIRFSCTSNAFSSTLDLINSYCHFS